MSNIYIASSIVIMAVITFLIRALPFLVLGNKPTPKFIEYLGRYLPYPVIGMLVVFCFKDVSFLSGTHGLPELIAAALTAALQALKRNTLLSIIAGTVLYMILIQFCF